MRLDVAFICFSAVLYTVYAIPSIDHSEEVKLKVKSAIRNVESIKLRIERVYSNTKEDTILAVTDRWDKQIKNYRDYVDLLIESMRRDVNNAKSRGVDAQFCYKANFWAINDHTDKAYEAAIKCIGSAEKSIESSLKFLDSLISLGDQLIKELNDIFLDCHGDDTMETQGCILDKFGKLNTAVKEFEEQTKYIDYSASSASDYVVLQASQCLTNAYLKARFESQSAMMSNSRCVRDAVEKKNKKSFIVDLMNLS